MSAGNIKMKNIHIMNLKYSIHVDDIAIQRFKFKVWTYFGNVSHPTKSIYKKYHSVGTPDDDWWTNTQQSVIFCLQCKDTISSHTLASLVAEEARWACRFGDLVAPTLWDRAALGLLFGLGLVRGVTSSRWEDSLDSSRRRNITGSNFSLVGEGRSAPSPAKVSRMS